MLRAPPSPPTATFQFEGSPRRIRNHRAADIAQLENIQTTRHARQLAESFVLNGGSPSDKDKYENFFAEWTARMPYKAPKAA